MKVNWKVRFRNKVWLTSFCAAILTFVYTILGMFDIYPEITKNDVCRVVDSILMFLAILGVIQDPTTTGLGDSIRALTYKIPWVDIKEDGTEEHTSEMVLDPDPEEGTVVVETSEPKPEG